MTDIPFTVEPPAGRVAQEGELAGADASEDVRAVQRDRARLQRDLKRSIATLNLLRGRLLQSEVERHLFDRRNTLAQAMTAAAGRVFRLYLSKVINPIRRLGLFRRRSYAPDASIGAAGVDRMRIRSIAGRLRVVATRVRPPRVARAVDLIRSSGVFDLGWYLRSEPAIEGTGIDPIRHYVVHGWRQQRDPNPLFSVEWYLRANPDVARGGMEPLTHYLQHGAAEGRDPHPLFDGRWYCGRYSDVAAAGVNPLAHFLLHGVAERRDPHPLFDSDWYLASNPDVAASGLNPLIHYVLCGAAEGRDPHPLFDSAWYSAQTPDSTGRVENPLLHYLQSGAAAGRAPHLLFNPRWYVARNPDLVGTRVNPLVHFVERGVSERRDHPHPLFSTRWYLANNSDVVASGINPLVHFVRFGAKELRAPHPFFDSKWYVEENPDIAELSEDPLTHYLRRGAAQRRDPHPSFATEWYLEKNPDAAQPNVNPLIHYLTVGIYRCAAPNPGVTQARCENLRRLVIKDPFYCPSPDMLGARSWTFTPALRQFLSFFYEADVATRIRSLYGILDRYGQRLLSGADLEALPELTSIVEELSQLSRGIALPNQIDATIIIPVHNQIVYTLCCLRALLGSKSRSKFEIIVADDLSHDATAVVIRKLGGIVHYHRNSVNLGFTRNCNAASKLARGNIIVFLNNDTIPLPNWLDELVDSLRADASIGLVGSKLLNSDGTLQEAGGILWQDGSAWNFGRGKNALAPEFNYVKDVDYVSGAALALRKSVWQELGGFDEVFVPAYCEDSDLAFRVRRSGLRTVYQPFSVVIHHEGVSHGRDLSTGVKVYQLQSNRILKQRWKDVLAREHFASGVDVMLARDRSRERSHILVIDHYIPQPDRDAGSRTIAHYLKLLQENGLQVSLWPQNRFFDRPYAQALQRRGIEVLYDLTDSSPIDAWLDRNGRYLKYVLVSRAGVALDFIGKLREMTKAKIFLYGHDVHFRRLEMEFAVTGNPATREEGIAFAAIEREVWSRCDVIYYPSEEERAFVSAEVPNKIVRALPPFIYSEESLRHTRARVIADRIPRTKQILFIGGFRHRPNVDAMLWFVSEIWPRVRAIEPEAHLCIAGSFPPPEIRALSGNNILVSGAISDETLRETYLSTQVVIVPLRFGAGIKGKVMEAASYGRPIVSTLVGTQGMSEADDFVTVCDSAETFAEAVIAVLKSPDLYVEKVLAGLDFVAKNASSAVARAVLALDMPELRQSGEHSDRAEPLASRAH